MQLIEEMQEMPPPRRLRRRMKRLPIWLKTAGGDGPSPQGPVANRKPIEGMPEMPPRASAKENEEAASVVSVLAGAVASALVRVYDATNGAD